jgi:hypothetical protein
MEDVSVHGFDAGPVWAQRGVVRSYFPFPRNLLTLQLQDVPPHSTYASLEKILAQHGGELLVDFLRSRATGDEVPQAPLMQKC